MRQVLLGNEAIARGLLESGCIFATSYPGTPASEILSSFMSMISQAQSPALAQWAINEKVAFETALTISYCGGRAAVSLKQVGLNVACDPLMSSAYTGVKGGFIIISADDPGPHSSQTEQDSRWLAMMAKIPVFDPSCPQEAKDMVAEAFQISEDYEIPVMLRPTTRICHSRQAVLLHDLLPPQIPSGFAKDPQRWAATPAYRYQLHKQLNEKISALRKKISKKAFQKVLGNPGAKFCIISSGVALAQTYDLIKEGQLEELVALYQVRIPYPLPVEDLLAEINSLENILIIEETYPVIEMQLGMRNRVQGRLQGMVPPQGELIPDVLAEAISSFVKKPMAQPKYSAGKMRRPTLCPGCPHRAAFYAIRQTFPQGIYPSDIGCYTLGLNLQAVDTVLCMGAAISQATGFYLAQQMKGENSPIVATIGDSTFYHAGIPALIDAVHQNARFILVILDNSTTAMTGNQPTLSAERLADGRLATAVKIEDLLRASGVKHLQIVDPYHLDEMMNALKKAASFLREQEGLAVIISRHPCLLLPGAKPSPRESLEISADCLGCEICLNDLECPAMVKNAATGLPEIDQNLCVGCGVCQQVCPSGAIRKKE